jgi:DNA-binding transcriptional LysR family regulator
MNRLEFDRMFVAVMETGSFAKAAARLGTSSGQASKLVSRLEQELGVRLLNRTTRALTPTEVGQAYFERIKQLLDDLTALDDQVKARSGAPSGRLRLTAPMSFGPVKLGPALIEFAELYPGIELDVNYTDRVVNLVDEGFDVAVRVGNPSDTSMIARKLCESRVVLAAAPAYLAKHSEPAVPHELGNHDCIIDTNFPDPMNWRFYDARSSSPITVAVHGRLRFSGADTCLAAAEKGFGITRVPSFTAGAYFRAGRLKPVLNAFEGNPVGVHALYPPGRHLALKVRVLVDFLVKHLAGQPEWDQGW